MSIPERQKIQSQLVAQFLPILLAQCLYFNDLQQKVLHFNVLRQKVPYFKVSRQKVPYFKVSRVELNCFATKKGSFWLSLALSGSLWHGLSDSLLLALALRLSLALYCSPNLLTKSLLGSQGSARSSATALLDFLQVCSLLCASSSTFYPCHLVGQTSKALRLASLLE